MRPATLAKTGAATLATALVGGLSSRPAQSVWFASLRKPSFQPPRQAFPIVWPILYADIAAVSAGAIDSLTEQGRRDEAKTFTGLLALNLVLNGGWTWLFFTQRRLGTAAVAAGALAVSSADLTRRAVQVNGASAAPLSLYPMWCTFATALSTRIWMLNR
jgi:tryptophan-rich sensory protein